MKSADPSLLSSCFRRSKG